MERASFSISDSGDIEVCGGTSHLVTRCDKPSQLMMKMKKPEGFSGFFRASAGIRPNPGLIRLVAQVGCREVRWSRA